MSAFPELERLVLATNASAKLLKDTLLLCLPVLLASFFKYPVELFLRLFPSFLYRRDEILFVSVAEIACNICVL